MNKRKYIAPSFKGRATMIETYLHTASNSTVNFANSDDMAESGITLGSVGLNNEATSVSIDANQRGGFGTDAGPWESLW